MPLSRNRRRSEATKRRHAAQAPRRPSRGFIKRQGTGQRQVRPWRRFGGTGCGHKVVIPENTPGKKFVLIVGDCHLRNVVDGFVPMPEGLLSFGFMSAIGACATELMREVVHAPDFRTPDAVCLIAPGNNLTASRTSIAAGEEFGELLASVCSKWPTVFVVDFPPRLDIEVGRQTAMREEFQHVAARMGVKYVTTADRFPLDHDHLWGRDGVHLSDSDGMPILVRVLWNAAYEHLHPSAPKIMAAPETSPVVEGQLMATPWPPMALDWTGVGKGRKRSPPDLVEASARSKRWMLRQQVASTPALKECFVDLSPCYVHVFEMGVEMDALVPSLLPSPDSPVVPQGSKQSKVEHRGIAVGKRRTRSQQQVQDLPGIVPESTAPSPPTVGKCVVKEEVSVLHVKDVCQVVMCCKKCCSEFVPVCYRCMYMNDL